MGASGIESRLADGVLRVTLDRPPLNILDTPMLEELARVIESAAAQRGAKVILLTGAGRAFCAGVDVAEHTADRVEGMLIGFHRAITALLETELPVVAAVNGAALGGGLELVLACDIVLLRAEARLGQPEVALGVFPPAAAALLPRLIGTQRALELILSGRVITSEEAYALGLGSRILSTETFPDRAEAYAVELARRSGPVLRLAKSAVREGLERPIGDALEAGDRLYLGELMALRDPHEGLAAFLEKREPAWSDA